MSTPLDRRQIIAAAGAAVLAPPAAFAAPAGRTLTKPIPKTKEPLPVVGTGTSQIYNFTDDAALYAERKATLEALIRHGAHLIDTAPAYQNAEMQLGRLLEDLKARDKVFLATKVPAQASVADKEASLKLSKERMRTGKFDLMQAWNVSDPNLDLAQLREWKAAGHTRYWGITSTSKNAYPAVIAIINREKPDFVQVDFSLSNRSAETDILPVAAANGAAVLCALPLGRNSMFAKVRGMALPDWAADIGAKTWGQVFLKYMISHPAVNAVIPGTDKPQYADDNAQAGMGPMPDAAMRKRMAAWWDSLPA